MAQISEILPLFWPGSEWTVDGDDYATLSWEPSNVEPKPSEAEIRARSAEADAEIAIRQRLLRQNAAVADAPDYFLKVIETIIEGMVEIRRVVNDIRSTTLPAAHTGSFTAWDTNVVNKMATLSQKVTNLRNLS